MGRRSRARGAAAPTAPTSDYADADGNVLTLRGALTLGARRDYDEALSGAGRPGATREDREQRALELLFERLAVRWRPAGPAGTQVAAPIAGQRELLARLRTATPAERGWVRETLRAHCAEWFPDVRIP